MRFMPQKLVAHSLFLLLTVKINPGIDAIIRATEGNSVIWIIDKFLLMLQFRCHY